MYHAIVRGIVRQGFAELSRGNPVPVLKQFAPKVAFSFTGNHALGADLQGVEGAKHWFERVFRIFPGLQIEVHSIAVSGWPWNTMVVTQFAVSASLPGQRPYRNAGIQFLRLRWGKVVEDRLIEDTLLPREALEYLAARGVSEASAKPLAEA
jgi:ketosteroid isomerase-like protein